MTKNYIIIALFLLSIKTNAQFNVKIIECDSIIESYNVADTESVYKSLEKYLIKKQKKGYIEASFDSIFSDSTRINAYFFKGKQYFWKDFTIYKGKNDIKIPLKKQKFTKKPINFFYLKKQIEKSLNIYATNGYPFAKIIYDTVIVSKNKISARIRIDKKMQIKFDSIYFSKKIKVSPRFLQNYLEFNKGDVYNQQIIDKIPSKLSNLPFISVKMPPEIEFHKKTADLYLYLENQKASQFSGLLGFTNKNNKFSIIGEANLNLVNLFNFADKISLKWQRTKEKSQNLDFNLSVPYIFNTNFGIENKIKIKKHDTSYVNVSDRAFLSYYFSGFSRTSFFVDFFRSIVFDTAALYENLTTTMYGISIYFNETNDNFSPTKGYIYDFSAGTGTKNIADTTNLQFTFEQNIDIYFSIFNNFIIHLNNFSYWLKGDNLLENELYKFGGAKIMRGFDEDYFSASFINLSSLEFSYLIEDKTSVFVFADYSIMQHKTISEKFWNHPFGIGAGFKLSNKNGLFSITYAIGKTDNTNFRIKNSRIHFGFTAFF